MPSLHPHLGVSSIFPLAFTTTAELRALSCPQTPQFPLGGLPTPLTHLAHSELSLCHPSLPPDLCPEPHLPLISPSLSAQDTTAHLSPQGRYRREALALSFSLTHTPSGSSSVSSMPHGASETVSPPPHPCCHSYSS